MGREGERRRKFRGFFFFFADFKILSNLAKKKARWRIPFRQGGILDFFLEVVATEDVSTDLNLEALRLIGNACANEGLHLYTLSPKKKRIFG